LGEPNAESLSFDSAESLFEALETPDAVERRNVLGWVATHPAETIALGPWQGRDVLDHLLSLIPRDLEYPYWEDITITIGAFDDPRATDFFVDLLATAVEAGQAYDAASALSRRMGAEGMRERLVEILLSEGTAERGGATAELLANQPDLPLAAAIRVAVLESESEAPALDDSTREAWLAELGGPFAAGARDRLQRQGLDVLHDLALHWERLDDEGRAWLVEWASDTAAEEPVAAALATRALSQGSERIALAGLAAAAVLPEGAVGPEALQRWAGHERAEVRGAAIAAGAPVDLDALLDAEDAAPEEMVAALPRIAARGGRSAAELVVPYLRSDSTEVRSAARDAAVGIGSDAIEPLRALVGDPSAETRAAAVRALLDLGDDDWLASELL
jgi:hypothetical protein